MVSFNDWSTMYEDNTMAVWAAIGATAALVPITSLLMNRSGKPPPPFLDSQKWQSLSLVQTERETHNVLRLTCVMFHPPCTRSSVPISAYLSPGSISAWDDLQ